MDLKGRLLAYRGRLRREPAAAAPELDGFDMSGLFVRELTAAERDDYEQSRFRLLRGREGRLEPDPQLSNIRARLLVLALCDAEGNRIFGGEDAAGLGELPAVVLDRWYEQAERLSGLDAGSDETLRKNWNGRAAAA